MTNYEKQAEEIFNKLIPKMNEIHPFQEEWAEGFSCSIEDMVKEIATALEQEHKKGDQEGFKRGVEEAEKLIGRAIICNTPSHFLKVIDETITTLRSIIGKEK